MDGKPVKTLEHEMAENAKGTLQKLKQQRAAALAKKKPQDVKQDPQPQVTTSDAKKE